MYGAAQNLGQVRKLLFAGFHVGAAPAQTLSAFDRSVLSQQAYQLGLHLLGALLPESSCFAVNDEALFVPEHLLPLLRSLRCQTAVEEAVVVRGRHSRQFWRRHAV